MTHAFPHCTATRRKTRGAFLLARLRGVWIAARVRDNGEMMEGMRIFTIGHSTRTAQELLALLQTHGIRQLADVRTMPMSRRHPQFNRDALAAFLAGAGLVYRHFPGLGGRRHPRQDSTNTAWQHPSFRGYADYLDTPAFARELDALLAFAADGGATTVMCAEAVWWQCHRRLLADALLVRGVDVRHIVSTAAPQPHELTPFARVDADGRLRYPGLLDVG